MLSRMLALFLLVLSVAGSAHAADNELVQKLKQLGKAVDDVAVNISNAASDADAQLLANVTQQTFANGLSADKPDVNIQATQGNCSVTIKTSQWFLWSQAQNGKIINHGAKIN